MKNYQFCIIKTTFHSKKEAQKIGKILLSEKLIACAQINEISSLYNWENKIQEKKEFLLSLKTTSKNYRKIEKLICKNHSYEIPQIIMIDITKGLEAYLSWLETSIK